MNAWTYLAIHDTVCICAGAYLIVHDYPWWAAALFFFAAITTIKQER